MFSFFKASRFLLKGKYRVIATLLANILPCTDSLEIGRALNHKGGEVSLSTGFCQITAFLVIHLTVFFEHPLVPEIMQLSSYLHTIVYCQDLILRHPHYYISCFWFCLGWRQNTCFIKARIHKMEPFYNCSVKVLLMKRGLVSLGGKMVFKCCLGQERL